MPNFDHKLIQIAKINNPEIYIRSNTNDCVCMGSMSERYSALCIYLTRNCFVNTFRWIGCCLRLRLHARVIWIVRESEIKWKYAKYGKIESNRESVMHRMRNCHRSWSKSWRIYHVMVWNGQLFWIRITSEFTIINNIIVNSLRSVAAEWCVGDGNGGDEQGEKLFCACVRNLFV